LKQFDIALKQVQFSCCIEWQCATCKGVRLGLFSLPQQKIHIALGTALLLVCESCQVTSQFWLL
jgi:hypothetical protein